MGIEVEDGRMAIRTEGHVDLAVLRAKVARRLSLGAHAQLQRFGLKRDLATPLEHPQAKIPLSVRPARPDDLERLLSGDRVAEAQERDELSIRRRFAAKVGSGAFVAIDERSGVPCYVQWLLGADKNACLAAFGGFPKLAQGEALLEDAYTPPSHRGLGIMSAAMAMIAEHGPLVGARRVITFVSVDNIASLKGCKRAGFFPYLVHTQRSFLFGTLRTNRFDELPAGDPRKSWAF